jgi:hypothetical protein
MQGFNAMKISGKFCCGIVGIMALSCGIFTPRPVEKPTGQTFVDPFRLYTILDKTGEQFSKTAYEDIINEHFTFIAWDNATYSRDNIIEQLKTLNASCNCEKINTVWDTCLGTGEIRVADTLTICRTFIVTYYRSSGNVSDTGKVQFVLNRSSGSIWTVVLWKEGLIRSIFHP